MREEILDLGRDDLLRIAGPEAGLDHRRRIDIDLNGRARPPRTYFSKLGGMSTMKVYRPRIHQRNDVALGDRLRRLKIGRQNRMKMRRDSSEWSSSTMAIEALCNSCELLPAWAMMAIENA